MTGFPRLAPGTFCSRKRQLMLEPSGQDAAGSALRRASTGRPDRRGREDRTGGLSKPAATGVLSHRETRPVPAAQAAPTNPKESRRKAIGKLQESRTALSAAPGIPAPLSSGSRGAAGPRGLPGRPEPGTAGLPGAYLEPGTAAPPAAAPRRAPSRGAAGAERALCPTAAAPSPAEPSQVKWSEVKPSRAEPSRASRSARPHRPALRDAGPRRSVPPLLWPGRARGRAPALPSTIPPPFPAPGPPCPSRRDAPLRTGGGSSPCSLLGGRRASAVKFSVIWCFVVLLLGFLKMPPNRSGPKGQPYEVLSVRHSQDPAGSDCTPGCGVPGSDCAEFTAWSPRTMQHVPSHPNWLHPSNGIQQVPATAALPTF